MIVTYIIKFIQYVLVWIIGFLPSGQTIPPDISNAVTGILSYSGGWNWILPVYEAVYLIQWTFYVYFSLIMWYLLKWLVGTIPFFGGFSRSGTPSGATLDIIEPSFIDHKNKITYLRRRKY